MRTFIKTLVAAAALASASAAGATTFIGSTQGCFGAGCTPTSTATLGGLTFTGGTFNQADSNGFLAIGGTTDNLGILALDGTALSYTGQLFTLLVTFTAPPGTTPGSGSYSALLTGSVTSNNVGGVFFDFNNNPLTFNYTGGTFTLVVNDVSVAAGSANQEISGQIRNTPLAIPEPATWGLMLLGFAGIGVAMRRRRRLALAQIA